MIALLILAAFGLFYMTGGCHVWYDGWRPWKHGCRWWEYYHQRDTLTHNERENAERV